MATQLAMENVLRKNFKDTNVWLANNRIAQDHNAMVLESTSLAAVCKVRQLTDGMLSLGNNRYLIDTPVNPEIWCTEMIQRSIILYR